MEGYISWLIEYVKCSLPDRAEGRSLGHDDDRWNVSVVDKTYMVLYRQNKVYY